MMGNFCINCKYYEDGYDNCNAPQNYKEGRSNLNYATGVVEKKKRRNWLSAECMRRHRWFYTRLYNSCGKEGRWFEFAIRVNSKDHPQLFAKILGIDTVDDITNAASANQSQFISLFHKSRTSNKFPESEEYEKALQFDVRNFLKIYNFEIKIESYLPSHMKFCISGDPTELMHFKLKYL